MNETELHDMFDTLTRNPAPSRYDIGSVRVASSRRKRRKWSVVGAAVMIGSLIAGTTWLFNPGDSPAPAPGILHPTNVVPWKAGPGPRPSPDLVAPLAGKPVTVTLDLLGYQRQSTPSSARYKFLVRLSNLGDEPVPLDPCPFYRVQFVKDVETGYLNCGQAPSEIPAAGHVDFEMEAPASDAEYLASSGGNGFGLLWQLGTEGSEGATAKGTAHLASPAEPVDLEGQWTLTALVGSDGNSVLTDSYTNRKRGISFENGRFEGTAGCNSLFGTYRQAGNNGRDLEFTQVGTTHVACPNESPLRERLRAVRHVSEVNGTLRLHDRYWMIIAVLERADDAGPSPSAESWPIPIPPKQTLETVHLFGSAQRYRGYTGPQPPILSETDAVAKVRGDRVYSLGMRDIGMVHSSGQVTWFHVWIIASDTFVEDGNRLSLGGRAPSLDSTPQATPTPRPVWSRGVTMIDTSSGRQILARFY